MPDDLKVMIREAAARARRLPGHDPDPDLEQRMRDWLLPKEIKK